MNHRDRQARWLVCVLAILNVGVDVCHSIQGLTHYHVHAEGCDIVYQPPYLADLGLGEQLGNLLPLAVLLRHTTVLQHDITEAEPPSVMALSSINTAQDQNSACVKSVSAGFCGRADFRKDLHNFAFLGRSPRIGTASDWVWYNVPHGPQKQVESFFQGQRCIREGREQVCRTQGSQAGWDVHYCLSRHWPF